MKPENICGACEPARGEETITIDIQSIADHLAGFARMRRQGIVGEGELRAIRFAVCEIVGEYAFGQAESLVRETASR